MHLQKKVLKKKNLILCILLFWDRVNVSSICKCNTASSLGGIEAVQAGSSDSGRPISALPIVHFHA